MKKIYALALVFAFAIGVMGANLAFAQGHSEFGRGLSDNAKASMGTSARGDAAGHPVGRP